MNGGARTEEHLKSSLGAVASVEQRREPAKGASAHWLSSGGSASIARCQTANGVSTAAGVTSDRSA